MQIKNTSAGRMPSLPRSLSVIKCPMRHDYTSLLMGTPRLGFARAGQCMIADMAEA